ncbi:HIT domain-containing protein [Candidatus Pacearchaeota archaeon]|nr:HIT domain-containing protein [Candidatus Pacearchaeota archaeon]
MLSKSQIKEVKAQLLKQIESWPESQRENAKEQINSLNDEELVGFLQKNNLIKTSESMGDSKEFETQSPFRLIVSGKIPSFKVGENKEAIAVLEINPISKAHTIIIPIRALKSGDMPNEILNLANEISDKIKSIFNPNTVSIASTEILGEKVIQILPVYTNETLNSSRRKADEKELKEIQNKMSNYVEKIEKPITKEEIKKEVKLKKLPKAPIRRP